VVGGPSLTSCFAADKSPRSNASGCGSPGRPGLRLREAEGLLDFFVLVSNR